MYFTRYTNFSNRYLGTDHFYKNNIDNMREDVYTYYYKTGITTVDSNITT